MLLSGRWATGRDIFRSGSTVAAEVTYEVLVDIVTIAILFLVVWCAAAVLIGLALGAVFRTVSHDDRLNETIAHDDALTRDGARLKDHTLAEPADDVDADVPHATEIRR